jgi:hypothetical protein
MTARENGESWANRSPQLLRKNDRGTALCSPPNVAVQRPTPVGANFAQAKFVMTKEVRWNGVLGCPFPTSEHFT